ncbi:hypothetical protein DNTS_015002, partial [Danionella cerebrum]
MFCPLLSPALGYGDMETLFELFYLRMLLLALSQATVGPWVFFPSDRSTHTGSPGSQGAVICGRASIFTRHRNGPSSRTSTEALASQLLRNGPAIGADTPKLTSVC